MNDDFKLVRSDLAADEFERRCEIIRGVTIDRLRSSGTWWFAAVVVSFLLFCSAARCRSAPLLGLGLSLGCVSLVPALIAASLAIGNWSFLPRKWLSFGLLPAAVTLAGMPVFCLGFGLVL